MGPIALIYPEGTFYCQLEEKDVKTVIEEHLIKGRIVNDLLYTPPYSEEKVPSYREIDFYKKQQRIALRNCGYVDPESIDEYIVKNGYEALGNVLNEKISSRSY